jgi:hypothetical protein
MKKRKNTDLLHFYRARGTLRNTRPTVPSFDKIWRTWHDGMSLIPSLEYFHHQKLDLFEFGVHSKVLAFLFLKLIRDSSDTKNVWLRSCYHVSILSGIGEFSIRHNFVLSESGVHIGSSCRMDTGVKAARYRVWSLSSTEKNTQRFSSFMFNVVDYEAQFDGLRVQSSVQWNNQEFYVC